jgi:hypothetical protein
MKARNLPLCSICKKFGEITHDGKWLCKYCENIEMIKDLGSAYGGKKNEKRK